MINAQEKFYSKNNEGDQVEWEPLDSVTKRDSYKIWKFVIREEQKLKEFGYECLTIGAHNFNRLLSTALQNKAFKCLVVLMEFYDEKLRE